MRLGFRTLFSLVCLLAGSPAFADDPVLAVDVSHWSGNITPDDVACWRANGVEHVIPGTQVESITRQQLQTAVDGGPLGRRVCRALLGWRHRKPGASSVIHRERPPYRPALARRRSLAGRAKRRPTRELDSGRTRCLRRDVLRYLHRQVVVGRLHAGLNAVLARALVVRVVRQRRESWHVVLSGVRGLVRAHGQAVHDRLSVRCEHRLQRHAHRCRSGRRAPGNTHWARACIGRSHLLRLGHALGSISDERRLVRVPHPVLGRWFMAGVLHVSARYKLANLLARVHRYEVPIPSAGEKLLRLERVVRAGRSSTSDESEPSPRLRRF